MNLPAMPQWLLDLCNKPEQPPEPAPLPQVAPADTRHSAYAATAFTGELTRLTQASTGERNDQLNRSAFALGQLVGAGWLDYGTVAEALTGVAQSIGLPRAESRATVKSGLEAGRKEPRVLEYRPTTTTPPPRISKGEKAAATEAERVNWLDKGVNARKLQHKLFAQVNWPVANILSEGCTLLAGKPKSKKSWLALAIAVDVAMGRPTLGGLDTRAGRVLYLDLESNQRRMQQRLRALLGNDPWPENLHIYTDWPKGQEGITQLENWMVYYPDTILVVCDILQNIRPARQKNANPYDEDYEAVKPLNQFGERHHAAVIAIHHTRKAKADDVFDEISGSTGLVAGVAGMWVIGRDPKGPGSILSIRGRDIVIDDDLLLTWNEYDCRFMLDDSSEERNLSQERRDVLHAMPDVDPTTPKEMAAILGKSVSVVNKMLLFLFNDGLVQKIGRGQYVKVVGRDHTHKSIPNVPNVRNEQTSPNVPNDDTFLGDSERFGMIRNGLDLPFRSDLMHQEAVNSPSERSERFLTEQQKQQLSVLLRELDTRKAQRKWGACRDLIAQLPAEWQASYHAALDAAMREAI